jgi:hypothetical protein
MTTPQDPPQAISDAIQVAIRCNDDQALTNRQVDAIAYAVERELRAAGYRIIQTDQAEHGDQLVQIERTAWEEDGYGGHLVSALSSNYQPAGALVFRLRRVVGNEQDTPQVPEQEHTP